MRIDLLVFDGMDLMDFAGPCEVFLTANRVLERRGRTAAFRVTTCSRDGEPVTAFGGIVVGAQTELDDVVARGSDLVIVPGAIDIERVLDDPELVAAVAALAGAARRVASVCTGAFALAGAGLLDGRTWTTHWEDVDLLATRVPGGVRERVVDAGPVLTAGGIACGLDLALAVVAHEVGAEYAELTARQIDYAWPAAGSAGSSTTT